MRKLLLLIIFLIPFGVRAAQPELLINEIAWMGTEQSSYHEWIELYNSTEEQINLKNWKLITADEDIEVNLEGVVEGNSFFILERTDDRTLPEIEADQIYKGGLSNKGEYLKLLKDGKVKQEINDQAGWRAGRNSENKTMERGQQWHTSRNSGGTPGKPNSEPIPKQEKMPASPLTSSLDQTYSDFWFTLLIAVGMSLFSAVVIYFLKKQLNIEKE